MKERVKTNVLAIAVLAVAALAGCDDGTVTVREGGLTPKEALAKLRTWRANGGKGTARMVVSGRVMIDEPIVLTGADRDLLIRGEDGATISGGLKITGWRDAGGGVWEADLPKSADGKPVYFEQLYVNGRRASCARLPNGTAYFRAAGQELRKIEDRPVSGKLDHYSFAVLAEADYAPLAALKDEDVPFARQIRHIKWDIDRHPLLSLDRAQRRTCVINEKWAGYNNWSNGDPIHFENVRTAFDERGEWYYDGVNGKVLYRPLMRESIELIDAVAPRDGFESLLVFRGDGAKGDWAGNTMIENVAFEHCDAKPYKGPTLITSYQAGAVTCCATILADATRNVTLRGCKVRHNGSYAVWLRSGCMSNTVVNCEFAGLGGGGVKIGEFGEEKFDCAPKGAMKATEFCSRSTAFNTVENCLIAHGGRVHMAGCGVLIGHASDCRIVHNDIFDLYYTGISVGWVWGYSGSVAQRNYVGYNHIRDIGQKQLADMGGIYTLGTSFGTVVEFNRIHDIRSYSYGGFGLYTDEGSEGVVMRNNLVYDTNCESYHQHYGRDNVISNNVFAFSGEPRAAIAITRTEPHRSIVFANNIVCFDRPAAVRTRDGTKADWQGNCWWQTDGKPFKMLNGLDFAAWQKLGRDTMGCVADPKFRDLRKRDFALADDSPALKCGFRPFDVSTAGCIRE